ncbi:twin-arginine translocation signal domain-containing protein [Hydrogenimonas sp.]
MINESRRTFLKGAAFSVAGASLATGVFESVVEAASETHAEFTNTPDHLDFYPPF